MAEVGFPAINLNSSLRDDILKKPSIKNVLTNEINAVANIPANIQSLILADTEAPGFFDANGFKAAGTAPANSYNELVTAIKALTPYNPYTIMDLTIDLE